ncbi:TPA: DUF4123 domain-containing protein [Vibrio cholerae]|nr:DUF4123 domain-containing protein [Vibrio cholerae]
MRHLVNYAVVDRAVAPEFIAKVKESNNQHWCLFPEPIEEDFALVAPFLVLMTPELTTQLTTKNASWGFFFQSEHDHKALRTHLRRLMNIEILQTKERLFFRYYDPRVLWAVLDGFEPLWLNHFLGPIQSVHTTFPQQRASDFEPMLTPYRPFGYEAFTPFPIEHTHYQAILAQCEQNLVDEVASMVGDKDKVFSKALVNQLIEWEISLPTHIKMVAQWCSDEKITSLLNFPKPWQTLLSNTQYPADYRIMRLQSEVRTTHVM